MLVEDPVFGGDKETTFLVPFSLKIGFPLRYNKYPETSIQHHVLSAGNCFYSQNLVSSQKVRVQSHGPNIFPNFLRCYKKEFKKTSEGPEIWVISNLKENIVYRII